MKDKSRFLSSVIVSLLAGFIYLLAGENIPVNIKSSVKAILSNNGPDQYLTTECFPFYELTKNSESEKIKTNSRFYLNKNDIGKSELSEVVSFNQVRFIIPTPDKKIDFTSELQKLINNKKEDVTKTDLSNFINNDEEKSQSCNELQVAEYRRNFNSSDRINRFSVKINSDEEDEYENEVENYTDEDIESDLHVTDSDSDSDFSISITNSCNNNSKVTGNKSVKINNSRNKVVNSVKTNGNKTFVKIFIHDSENECEESYNKHEYDSDKDLIELPD